MLIKDLVPGVIKKLRNRDDITEDIPVYIKKAILDITQNNEFEELRVTGPLTTFNPSGTIQAVYPTEGQGCPFLNPDDRKLTFVVTWMVFFNPVTVADITNIESATTTNTGFIIKYRQPRVVEPMSVIPGQPTYYSQVGNNLIVGFAPSMAYPTYMRYQKQHPFNESALESSVIRMPDDWQDILEYAAAEKACDDTGMDDLGLKYHQKLYGYKDRKGNEMPGLIMGRQTQQTRNATYNETQMRPVVRRYTR